MTDDAAVDVGLEAIDALFRVAPPEAIPIAIRWLDRADGKDVAALVAKWIEHEGSASALHETLRSAPVSARIAAVMSLVARWSDVASVAADADPNLRAAVRGAFWSRLNQVPIDVLARWVEDAAESKGHNIPGEIVNRLSWGETVAHHVDLLGPCRRRLAVVEAALRSAGVC